ncbi:MULTISPECIES: hypothetical protein [unclassified Arthrobacter]|uniref:hypothetical protein n=1 Tax=unclassified Arthrobacter TaxID=235627 RepID=UPI001E2B6AE2|nr:MULTISPECIES: hypothetical protein [unclassified Arthrobacter]MCC9146251.1 hypothetical protein [Arthrobacter sp. zg-Y919]MDK1277481.1 hypothetical protein [Arthrobacter sp. zg.Y919]WIB03971.1 hypothetical protein QNO10_04715 [Arthrobacter sp. zg-Y919]
MIPGGEAETTTFRTVMPVRYRLIVGLLGFAATGGTVLATLGAGPAPFVVGLLMALAFSAVVMMTARVGVGPGSVQIRVAAVFATEIPYREIRGVSAGPVTGLREGMGLRILPGATGYLVGGPSIRIECGPIAVLVSCREPERLLSSLARQGVPTA